jgi:hypothetical protein
MRTKKTNLDRWIKEQEAACRRTKRLASMPVALRLIRAAIGAPDPGVAMQAALDEALEGQAPPAKPVPRKRRAATIQNAPAIEDDPDDDPADDDSDRAMFLRQDREQAQIEARQKNAGRAEGEPEFAPCDDCGFVHNESFCPRCEGDGEEDLLQEGKL